ncbi:PREDICTED: kxDL motif-containing protein CG10681 [Drosophila arizonae]|uniref:KxDL motif-containing protein CG10681 n=1 Tax=Drosophila arizonae TaxID=7263 RepID=A0ABM1P2G1_DROAR|nr:PREDICTED: kxDL motif-containing protein CG10681 [Drosophila arizonae]XP_017861398.1 PREDICTED: kxDL motif-containing protein CG10681 [Drosophila arizonae]
MSEIKATDIAEDNADTTPDLESFNGYEFSNCTAAESFIQGLSGMVNQSDVETMIRAQKQMLQRFEKTNEMLLNCNALSQSRLKNASEDFKRHVKLLSEMKKDLDYIFRKVRIIKQKLQQQYPAIYAEVQPQRSSLAEEAEDETETAKAAQLAESSQPKPTAEPAPKKGGVTIEYVQMQEAIENGIVEIENELIKRVCSVETANPNDSSDCTSEDTG